MALNSWRMDDLDCGLSDGLSNLQGLGSEMGRDSLAYNMSEVLNLPMFKTETPSDCAQALSRLTDADFDSLPDPYFSLPDVASENDIKADINGAHTNLEASSHFAVVLKSPTSPGKKLHEETLTYLNQSQSYEVILQCIVDSIANSGENLSGIVRLGFHERKYQVIETEKYEEWIANRPNDRLLEIDVPLSVGIYNIKNVGEYLNCLEFHWNPKKDTRLYIRVNCVSSEFTKGKSGGESGIPLRLQIDILPTEHTSDSPPLYSCGCQIKVFKPKGADRKLKAEKQKHENLSKEELENLQSSLDVTVLKSLEPLESPIKHSRSFSDSSSLSSPAVKADSNWLSPCSSMFSQLQLASTSTTISTPLVHSVTSTIEREQVPSKAAIVQVQTLTSESTVEEAQAWLRINRFHNYSGGFANFTGADLLRLTRNDMIQLCGTADGIRLHNALQSRASRPLLTMYVSPEWHKNVSNMREYHAMFLEHLTVEELVQKLALKCDIKRTDIIAVYKQGPTGILILVDDEMVRNFIDEAHHAVQIIKDEKSNHCRLILK